MTPDGGPAFSASPGTRDHGALNGLADPDHPVSALAFVNPNALAITQAAAAPTVELPVLLDRLVGRRTGEVGGLLTALTALQTLGILVHVADVNPTAADDITAGYAIGHVWVRTGTVSIWICSNNAAASAIWCRLAFGPPSAISHALAMYNGTGGQALMDSQILAEDIGGRWNRREFKVQASEGVFQYDGIAAAVESGVLTPYYDSDASYITCTTAGGAGSDAGLLSAAFHLVRRNYNPRMRARVRIVATTQELVWVGFFASDPGFDDMPVAVPLAAFRFSWASPNWWCCTGDGANIHEVDSGVAVTAGWQVDLEIQCLLASVFVFKINGTTVATSTTNMPGAATDMGYMAKIFSSAAAAKAMRVSLLYCDFGS